MGEIERARRLLMHVGPVTIEDEVLLAGMRNNVGFSSPEFVEAMGKVLRGLRKVFGVDDSYQTFAIVGGGTSAMESVVSLLRKGEKVLVISNGVFGDRWEPLLKRYPLQVNVLRADPGDYVPPEAVEDEVIKGGYTAVTMTHVETSTGVRHPVEETVKRVRDRVDLIVVDGVSAAGAETVKAKDWGVDVYLTASQKALGAPPGLGLLALSGRALERLKGESVSGYLLDLRNWLPVMRNFEEGKLGYFSTLPVHTVLMLAKSLELIEKEGLENRIARHERVARAIRAGVEGMGLKIVARRPEAYSNTVTGVIVNGVDPAKILSAVINEGVELAPGVHPKLQGRYFRIGHMGWVTPNDAIATIAVLERVLKSLGEDVRVGEGVKAAQLAMLS
ncbi:MAG: alanine--glyoxylate aminotransferase family protein, partial [Sulfolobaceae archaeon]